MNVFPLFGQAVLEVFAWGLLFGAGLPALFAVGVRLLAVGYGGDAEVDNRAGNPVAKAAGWMFMMLVVIAILLGLAFIVGSGLGMELTFEHGFPTYKSK